MRVMYAVSTRNCRLLLKMLFNTSGYTECVHEGSVKLLLLSTKRISVNLATCSTLVTFCGKRIGNSHRIHRMEEPKSNSSPAPCVRLNNCTNQPSSCYIHRIPCPDLGRSEVFYTWRRTSDRAHVQWQASARRKWVYWGSNSGDFMDPLTLSLSAGSTTKGTGCHSMGKRFSDSSGFMNAASRLSELITQRSVWLLKTRKFSCE